MSIESNQMISAYTTYRKNSEFENQSPSKLKMAPVSLQDESNFGSHAFQVNKLQATNYHLLRLYLISNDFNLYCIQKINNN